MSWQRYFRSVILDRGFDYYSNNAVKNFRNNNGTLTAIVSGTHDYEIEIIFDNDLIEDMFCSCPHAEDGNYCKHMAAVLFESENNRTRNNTFAETDNTQSSAKDSVSNASEEMIREFLIQTLENNKKLLLQFNCFINKAISQEDLTNLKLKVDAEIANNAIKSHTYGYRYNRDFDDEYDYNYTMTQVESLRNFLNDDVRMLLENRCYRDAFELTCHIYRRACNLDLDDYGAGMDSIADDSYTIWLEVIANSDIEEKKFYFELFLNFIDEISYEEECFEHVIMVDFFEDEFIQRKLDFINEKIAETDRIVEDHLIPDDIGSWALFYIRIMEAQEQDWELIAEYCKKYLESSIIKDYYVDSCVKQKNYSEAIRVLEENVDKSAVSAWRATGYTKRLKELYLLTGNTAKYKEQLWKLVLEYGRGDLELYRELKSQYSVNEWKTKREKILSMQQSHHYIGEYFVEEKLYDRLLDYALNQPGLYALERYLDVLKTLYPKEVLQRYRNEVEQSASRTTSRSVYSSLVSILRKMKTIPGGEEAVKEITLHWQLYYSNRRAMMDELGKL